MHPVHQLSVRLLRSGSLLLAAACASPSGVHPPAPAIAPELPTAERLYPGGVDVQTDTFVTRLVDDLSGEPVAGAEVFLCEESNTPIGGEFSCWAKGTSDAEGFVRIPIGQGRKGYGLPVVRHPDHAEYGTGSLLGWQSVWRLGRAVDVPVRIVDWLGKPAPGARLGFCGGCGHTPDLQNAVADANGIAVLRGIDPKNDIADLYVQQPGLGLFYEPVEWLPGGPPMEVRCSYSPVLTGKLVDHEGHPVAGAFVEGGGVHRGPWARTAADGTFAIVGADLDSCAHHVVLPGGRSIYFPTSYASPVTLHLPGLADPDVYEGTVAPVVAELAVAAVREVAVAVRGAPGALTVGTTFPGQPDPGDAHLDEGHVLLPAAGPFVLTVGRADSSSHAGDRLYPFPDATAIGDTLQVDWLADVRVVGRAVDGAGRPIAAKVRIVPPFDRSDEVAFVDCPDGTFDLPGEGAGTWMLELATPEHVRRAWIVVPPRGEGGRAAVGDIAVGEPPQLRVVGAAGGSVGFARAGWQEVGEYHAWPLAADGTWLGPDLRSGDAIVVERDDYLPFRSVLRGSGPWTVTPPDGELTLDIVDQAGAPCGVTIVVDDHEVVANGQAVLRGLSRGAHRVWISQTGFRTAVLDVEVGAEPRRERVVLQPR